MPFPTTFSQELIPLAEVPNLSDAGHEAVERLAARGIIMMSGLQEEHLPGILKIARTDDVVEFCPKDATDKRFLNPQRWLDKGRGAFVGLACKEVRMYSWTGYEPTPELPHHPITTAFRTALRGTGVDLVIATVEGSRALHNSTDGYGLETWRKNLRAIKVYERTGAQLETEKTHEENKETGELERAKRPTLDVANADLFVNDKPYVYDARRFYSFPKRFRLPRAA